MKYFVILSLLVLASCTTLRFPGVHRINVQQGNVISQSMIDRLKPGMTKSQVRFVLGNPVIDDSLDENRWDYVYTVQVAGGETQRQALILFFLDNKLSYFESDLLPTENEESNSA